ncbi:MAG: DUF2760 domain-containing protein [Noviherbaspirillum sp.]
MQKDKPSLFARIPIAFGAFFRSLGNADFAARVDTARQGEAAEPAPEAPPEAAAPPAPALREISPDAALQLLALLQRDARLIDFTQENLAGYSDADIGAAARVVHEGCVKVLREHFSIEAVRPEAEGARITLEQGFDAAAIRLTGNVVGQAPFSGTLTHRGWRVAETRLPKLAPGHDASVITPAEVEL